MPRVFRAGHQYAEIHAFQWKMLRRALEVLWVQARGEIVSLNRNNLAEAMNSGWGYLHFGMPTKKSEELDRLRVCYRILDVNVYQFHDIESL